MTDRRTGQRQTRARRWVYAALSAAAVLAVAGGLVMRTGSRELIVRDDDGCPHSVGATSSVFWMDVVRVDGRTYQRVDVRGPSTVEREQLGKQIDVIDCSIADDVQSHGYELRDGEATSVPVGSRVHTLARTPPSFRVAVVSDGPPTVYEHRAQRAATLPDNLPVPPQQVTAVAFIGDDDGHMLGRITDPDEVTTFVAELNRAGASLDRPRLGADEPRVFVELELFDQPAYTLIAYPDRRITLDGIELTERVLSTLPPVPE